MSDQNPIFKNIHNEDTPKDRSQLIHDMKNNVNIIYGYIQLEIQDSNQLKICTEKINDLIKQIDSIRKVK